MVETYKIERGDLFVSGGGNADDTILLDRAFVKSLSTGRLLYVPIGLERTYIGYEECYDWITKTLGQQSSVDAKQLEIAMWVSLAERRLSDLDEFDAIYIGGAKNSYAFMKQIRHGKFDTLLRAFLRSGKSIYGGSTGAIAMGKDISVLNELPLNDYQDTDGLGFLGNYSIFCHYTQKSLDQLRNFLTCKRGPVIALTERSGLVVRGHQAQSVGFEGVFIFKIDDADHPQYIKPDENFTLDF